MPDGDQERELTKKEQAELARRAKERREIMDRRYEDFDHASLLKMREDIDNVLFSRAERMIEQLEEAANNIRDKLGYRRRKGLLKGEMVIGPMQSDLHVAMKEARELFGGRD